MQFCEERYATEGKELIESIRKNLEDYAQAPNEHVALQVLLALDENSLGLSCLHTGWIDFNVAIFEALVVPNKAHTPATTAYLTEMFEATQRRILSERPNPDGQHCDSVGATK